MGALFETQAFYVSDPGAATAYTAVSGDSLVNRFFQAPSTASLISFDMENATGGYFRVRSPLLYDNVKGIHIVSAAGQTLFALPVMNAEVLQSQDTLIMEGSGGGAEYEVITMTRYYSNFQGSDMRLYSWGTIMPLIVHLYEIEINTISAATPTAWTDTGITYTEDLLKANIDHAVLGWTVDAALGGVALKGADTSNFRYGGPGIVLSPWTPNYFVRVGEKTGLPAIPVINSANKGNTFVSTIDAGISTPSKVTLHVAELARNLA
jgi:hypothetical protein